MAMALSAALFGLMHAGNHGATTFSTVAVALEAGGMLAAAYVWSRQQPVAAHRHPPGLEFHAGQDIFSAPIWGGAGDGPPERPPVGEGAKAP